MRFAWGPTVEMISDETKLVLGAITAVGAVKLQVARGGRLPLQVNCTFPRNPFIELVVKVKTAAFPAVIVAALLSTATAKSGIPAGVIVNEIGAALAGSASTLPEKDAPIV